MFSKKPSKPQNRIDTLIGADTKVVGDVAFNGGLRVDGMVRGNVSAAGEAPSTLVLSENAKIEGKIAVSHAVINGAVVGPVHATEYVELQSKCHVTGDVFYKTLEMHMGAIVEGKLVHVEGAAASPGFNPATAVDQSA